MTTVAVCIPGQRSVEFDLERVFFRWLQDVLTEASAGHWERRARQFDQARPRAEDYTGQATAEDLAEADRRCAQTARACRNHAEAIKRGWIHPYANETINEVLNESA